MRKTSKIILFGFALAILIAALVGLALPLWLPWVLPPIAAKYNLQFAAYQREGYGRFVLRGVHYRSGRLEFRAGRVEGLLPYHWLTRKFSGSTRSSYLK